MSGIQGPTGLDVPIEVLVISGVEGPSVSINDLRVAGPKPWGGGHVLHRFTTTGRDLLQAIAGRPPATAIGPIVTEAGAGADAWHHEYRRRETPLLLARLAELGADLPAPDPEPGP